MSLKNMFTRPDEPLRSDRPKHKIFCFKDEKSESYGPPMTVETQGMFVRQIQEALETKQAIWAKHPQDFAIFELGNYDAQYGQIELHENKKCLGLVQDFKVLQS